MGSGNIHNYGDRNPAVWVAGKEQKIVVSSGVNGNANFLVFPEKKYSLNTWIPIKISQRLVGDKFVFEAVIAGDTVISQINDLPTELKDVKVFGGNPWYPPQEGKIKNLVLKTENDGVCVCNARQDTCGKAGAPCKEDGKIYSNGEIMPTEDRCTTCSCKNGKRICLRDCNSISLPTTTKPIPPVPAESSCVWSVDCYDKTKRRLCSGPWHDAPCKCIFGKCRFTTDVAYRDGCTTYKDCDCKHNRDTCFCVGGSCNLRGPWECHQHPGEKYSEDCKNMKKCDGIRCYCNDGACEKLEDNSTEPIGTGTSGNIDILDVEKTSPTPIGGLCWENKETMKECNGTCIPKLNLCNGSCSPNQCLKKDNSSCVEMFEDGNIFRKMLFKECKGHCIPASKKCEDQCLASQCWEVGSGECVSPKLDRTQKQTQKGIYSWKNCEGNCIKSSDTCNSTCGDQKLFCLDEKSKKCLSLEETNEQGKKLRSQCRGLCIPFGEKCDGGCGATECEQDGKCLDALQLDKKNERIRQFCEGKCIPWGEVCGAK